MLGFPVFFKFVLGLKFVKLVCIKNCFCWVWKTVNQTFLWHVRPKMNFTKKQHLPLFQYQHVGTMGVSFVYSYGFTRGRESGHVGMSRVNTSMILNGSTRPLLQGPCTCRSIVGAYSYLLFSPFHLLLPSQQGFYFPYYHLEEKKSSLPTYSQAATEWNQFGTDEMQVDSRI